MTDKIKSEFDKIRAEKTLKEHTVLCLFNEINKRSNKKNRFYAIKLALVCFVVILFTGFSFFRYYMNPNVYIDVEINPSIELIVNAFNNIIDVHAYNQEGEDIILNHNFMHMNYNDALSELINAVDEKGFIQESRFIFVTLQTNSQTREDEVLDKIRKCVETAASGDAFVEVFPVNEEIRSHAHKLNLSPAKYLAIVELMEVDSTATVEGCMGHSIGQLRSRTQQHSNSHTSSSESDSTINSDKMCGTSGINHRKNHHNGSCD